MSASVRRALVVGGGIVGLTAGIALRRMGAEVVVFEQAPQVRAAGASLGLWANALRAFDELEIGVGVRAVGRPSEMQFHDPAGRKLTTPDFGPDDHSYLLVNRAHLNDLLASAVGSENLRLDHRFERFEEHQDEVTAHFSNGTSVSGDLLVAADGAFSAVRTQLLTDAAAQVHEGHLSWRAILPETPRPIEHDVLVIGHNRCRGGYVRAPEGGAFWLISQFQSPPASRSAKEECLARAEHLDDGGWNSQLGELIAGTPDERILFNPTMLVPSLQHWVSERVALIGDAAHAMSPHITAGASLGVQDPVVLARCLLAEPDVPRALAAYEEDRIPHYATARRLSAEVEAYTTPAEFAQRYAAFSHWMIRH